jgi:hypothetical protein
MSKVGTFPSCDFSCEAGEAGEGLEADIGNPPAIHGNEIRQVISGLAVMAKPCGVWMPSKLGTFHPGSILAADHGNVGHADIVEPAAESRRHDLSPQFAAVEPRGIGKRETATAGPLFEGHEQCAGMWDFIGLTARIDA